MAKTSPEGEKSLLAPAPKRGFFGRLRNNFLTGIIVVAPFGITLYLTWTIVDYVDRQVLPQVLPLIPEAYHPENILPFSLPGLGLVVFALFLVLVGALAKNFFGRELVRLSERTVDRMPVVRSLYNGLKQIAETVFAESSSSFERACLVEYPRKGIWAIAFVSTDARGEIVRRVAEGGEMVSIFLPTTPNPTSGFLLFVPKEDVVFLDMTVEEAAKLVISAGLISPDDAGGVIEAQPAAARDEAGAEADPASAFSLRHGRTRPASSPGEAAEAAARNPLSLSR